MRNPVPHVKGSLELYSCEGWNMIKCVYGDLK